MPGLLEFPIGAFLTAAQLGLPVVPITICGTRSILRSDFWLTGTCLQNPRKGDKAHKSSLPGVRTSTPWRAQMTVCLPYPREISQWFSFGAPGQNLRHGIDSNRQSQWETDCGGRQS